MRLYRRGIDFTIAPPYVKCFFYMGDTYYTQISDKSGYVINLDADSISCFIAGFEGYYGDIQETISVGSPSLFFNYPINILRY